MEEGAVIRLKNDYEDTPIKRELGLPYSKNEPADISLEEIKKLL